MQDPSGTTEGAVEVRCAQCNTLLAEGQDREVTDDGVFCRPCFNNLTAHLRQAIEAQSADINYPMAVVGGLLGGAVGILAWWGFTVVTKIHLGLVAVVIGLAVGKGVTLLAGNKRSQGLQALSVVIAALSFVYASYLVTRTFIHQSLADAGEVDFVLPLVPDPDLLYKVLSAGFEFFDVIFLGIVLYEAWILPRAIKVVE